MKLCFYDLSPTYANTLAFYPKQFSFSWNAQQKKIFVVAILIIGMIVGFFLRIYVQKLANHKKIIPIQVQENNQVDLCYVNSPSQQTIQKIQTVDFNVFKSSSPQISNLGEVTNNCNDAIEKNSSLDGHEDIFLSTKQIPEEEFEKDVMSEFQKYVDTEGAVWEGTFKDGKLNGHGTVTYSDGEIHEGIFLDDELQDGPCKFIIPEGVENAGLWEGILKDEKLTGKVVYPSGKVCEGEFTYNVLNGEGRIIEADGTLKEGLFADGKLNGLGKVIYPDGKICEGEFVEDKLNGEGKIIEIDGRIREGIFVDGKLHGKGTITLPNGFSYTAEVENDEVV